MKNALTLLFAFYFSALAAQWERLDPPGVVGAVQFAHTTNRLFAVAIARGIGSVSNTNGITWDRLDENPNYPAIPNYTYPIAVAAEGNVVVLLFQDQFGDISWYVSSDEGDHWSAMTAAPQAASTAYVHNGNLYAYEFDSFYKYNSSTHLWDLLLQTPADYQHSFAFYDDNIWESSNIGLRYSANGGLAWVTIGPPAGASSVAVVNSTLAVVSNNDVLYSVDNGLFWQTASLSGNNIRVMADGGKFYAISDDKVYQSLDGIAYTLILSGLGNVDNLASINSILIASTQYGAYRTPVNSINWTWVSQPNAYIDGQIKAAGEVLFYTDQQTAFSMDYGANWQVTNGLNKFDDFLFNGGIWYALKGKEIWTTTDLIHWAHTNDLPAGANYWAFKGNDLISKAGVNIFTYNTGSATWVLTTTLASGDATLFIYHDLLYAHLQDSPDLLQWQDLGQQWVTFPSALSADPNVYSFVATSDKIYALSFTHLQTSVDDGLSFAVKPLQVNGYDGCVYFDNGLVISASDVALYYGQNDGLTWAPAMSGFEGVPAIGLVALNNAVIALNSGYVPFKRVDFDNSVAQYGGATYRDINNNGWPEVGEPPLPNTILHLDLANRYTSSLADGNFNIAAEVQNQTLTAVSPSQNCHFVPANYTVNASNAQLNFGLQCTPGITDLKVTLANATPFRPGFETDIFLTASNPGTVAADGNITLTLASELQFISATPAATVAGNVLTWNFTAFPSLDHQEFVVRVKTLAGTLIGTQICNTAHITPTNDVDHYDTDNTTAACHEVVGAYDPNGKAVDKPAYPPNTDAPPLVYSVYFQNTGNYPASLVVIKDTLSPNLDPATLQVLGASHPFTWSLRGNGIIEFRFEGINLPGMLADEPGSHGFVLFSVKPKANLPLGVMTKNTAFIYFDFNQPVVTNTVTTTVTSTHEPVIAIPIQVQPNPAYESVRLHWPDRLAPGSLNLYLHDNSGRLLETLRFDNQDITIDVRTLPAGSYPVWGSDGVRYYSAKIEVIH